MRTFLVSGIVLLFVASLGCIEGEPPKKVTPTGETKEVPKTMKMAYLDFGFGTITKNWDADANKDGIETTIYPKSADGSGVKLNATVVFTLYQTRISSTTFATYNVKLQEWKTTITDKEGGYVGIGRRLEFDNNTEKIVAREDMFMGELWAKLITPDGKTFEAKTNVF